MHRRSVPVLCLSLVWACSNAAAERDISQNPPDAPDGMIYIAAGSFVMGHDGDYADELPRHEVRLDAFFIDKHEVTNAEFAAFVEDTGYVTTAERNGYSWCYLRGDDDFTAVEGANWRHPTGPDATIEGKMDHPVVHVSWYDAQAYAKWAGKRLPTEAEWEYAARAGRAHISAQPHGQGHDGHASPVPANTWQGVWPKENRLEDSYFYTAPVGSFPSNPWGLHDVIGNVWEWCADWYSNDYYARSDAINPKGPAEGDRRVARGGSWFCSPNYCGAYTSHYRGATPPDQSFNNIGLRCAADLESATASQDES